MENTAENIRAAEGAAVARMEYAEGLNSAHPSPEHARAFAEARAAYAAAMRRIDRALEELDSQ